MDKIHPCHCNGTRGTDCDWCQGSGFRSGSSALPSTIKNISDKKPASKLSEKKDEPEKMYVSSGIESISNIPEMQLELMPRLNDFLTKKIDQYESIILHKHVDYHLNEMCNRLGKANTKQDENNFSRDYIVAKRLKKAFLLIKRGEITSDTKDIYALLSNMKKQEKIQNVKNVSKITFRKVRKMLFPKSKRR